MMWILAPSLEFLPAGRLVNIPLSIFGGKVYLKIAIRKSHSRFGFAAAGRAVR